MENIITDYDNYLTDLILKHIKNLSDCKNFWMITSALSKRKNEPKFNFFTPYIPDIFQNKIESIDYSTSRDDNNWDYHDGIVSTININFESNCSICTGCTYKTYYDSCGDLQYESEDESEDEPENKSKYQENYANFDSKTKTRSVILCIEDDKFDIFMDDKSIIIDKNALKLLEFLNLKINDINKKKLGILIENLINVVQQYGTESCHKYSDIDKSVFNYEYISKDKLIKKLTNKKIE
ncbi:hypothetical protein QLL95_gp0178 [Cotonvirus japonicus]|uniref:Uncharacterized protein n=1 Tax=Cotonvirus japonicus TaxID=2811091 RepID=A0ABM7NRF0_9VIRU|nr:hypothetical protein QLL95_gp0178 [Cotonvirus japonicus]BCS82667.1 hypothetical protein [Cotonvirus japonicus]